MSINPKLLFKSFAHTLDKNSPAILTGVAVAGVIGTAVLAVKATPRAYQALLEAGAAKSDKSQTTPFIDNLTVTEKIKYGYKPYIPAITLGAFTITCIIASNRVSSKRAAVLASAYSIAESSLKEYKGKVSEVIGERKADTILGEVAQDKLNKQPISESNVIITGKGESLAYESLSGRYFKCDIEDVRRVQNDINQQLLQDMWVSLNEVYDRLGLEHTLMGDDLGWEPDNMLEFNFQSKLATDGTPCLVLSYVNEPKYAYR